MASDEEVQKKQESVATLRQKVKDARAGVVEKQRDVAADVTMLQLNAEEQRLQAELEQIRRTTTKTAIKDGAAPVLENAKEQMRAATEAAKAQSASTNNDK